MKRQWIFSLLILLLIPRLSVAISDTPNIPLNIKLTATETTITVDWTGDSNAEGYYVYWGTTSGSLDHTETVTGTSTTDTTISGLTPGTTYYVALASYNNSGTSNRSDVQSIATTNDVAKPDTPTGLDVTSVGSITENSVILKWDRNSESDLDHYTIYYSTTSGSADKTLTAQDDDASSFTVSGLTASTRYYFTISATDTAKNESDKSKALIVDTLTDTLPPYAPAKVSGFLSDIREITITITDGNAQMADFAGNKLFYGTTSGNLDQEVDLGNGFSFTLTDLEENSTWYFSALSYDSRGNESGRTDEASAVVEKTERYLNDSDGFDGGCFIGSAAPGSDGAFAGGFFLVLLISIIGWLFHRRRNLAIMMMSCLLILSFSGYSAAVTSEDLGTDSATHEAQPSADPVSQIPAAKTDEGLGANIAGVFAGYYLPAESKFEDFYGNDVLLLSAFFERRLTDFISLDVESGFLKEKGHLLTESGAETGIETDLTMVPVSVSLNVYYEFMRYVVGYAGAGPDYWYCREETDVAAVYPEIKEWVGGCHGKAGVKLYNTDDTYKNTGAIIETSYSWIDRFGGNDTDLGGWAFKFGLFYQF
ncbi:MAG: fibronectin type III domain-containing protein [Desulfosalsimonadaceae bacterium]